MTTAKRVFDFKYNLIFEESYSGFIFPKVLGANQVKKTVLIL